MKKEKKENKNTTLVTEISEKDFRKLNLCGYRRVKEDVDGKYVKMAWKCFRLNEELDHILESDLVTDTEKYEIPVTFAIHNENGPHPEDYYLDKFMNCFTGAVTVQMGIGIKHLYSTRDYFEDHEDYWRVPKKYTKVIYRVHLERRY